MQFFLFTISIKVFTIIVGLFYFKKLNKAFRYILWQVIVVSGCETLGNFTSYHSQNNLWVFNFFYLLPELWLTGMAARELTTNSKLKKATPYLLGLGTFVWGINITVYGINIFANWALIYIGVTLCIIYMNVLIKNSWSEQSPFLQPEFWLSLSVILFFSCNIPYYGMFNFLSYESPVLLRKLFYINKGLNFIRYPLIALSFYLYARQRNIQLQKAQHNIF